MFDSSPVDQRLRSSFEMIRALKGAPLSVLLLLVVIKTPVSQGFIRRHTGYSDEAISDALAYLKDLSYVTHGPGRYDWQIAAGVRQLPLMHPLIGEGGYPEDENVCAQTLPAPADVEAPAEDGVNDAGRRHSRGAEPVEKPVENFSEICHSSAFSGASSDFSGAGGPINNDNLLINCKREKIIISSPSSAFSEAAEILRLLQDAGIAEPKRSMLAQLPHVNRRAVRYHLSTARNIRLAIYQLEHNWPVPVDWVDSGDQPDEIPEEAPVLSLPAAESLQPLGPEQLDLWRFGVGSLECSRADKSTWLAMAPDGISASGDWVIRCPNRYGAEWIHTNALAPLETMLKSRLQLEVPDKGGRWVKFEYEGVHDQRPDGY